jgi:F420-dependent methylenetetrahydromethanopterin dehydrogenase
MDADKLVVAQSFGSQGEADLAKSVLESAGIDSAIVADRAGGMRDHLAWSGFGFKLLVREEDAAAAHEILQPVHKAPEGKLVVVQTCGNQRDADVAQGALESAGIAAAIEAVPVPHSDPYFRIMVREKDAVAAGEVLNPS